jgi:hypothetical protein
VPYRYSNRTFIQKVLLIIQQGFFCSFRQHAIVKEISLSEKPFLPSVAFNKVDVDVVLVHQKKEDEINQ